MARWTAEQREAIKADPILGRLGVDGLDALLTDDERAALREHLTDLANLRQRGASSPSVTPEENAT